MDLPPLTYLTFDEVGRGVGASQIVPYVERFAQRGLEVILHTFEQREPSTSLRRRLEGAGVDWRAHRFGGAGSRGAARRVAVGAWLLRGARLAHARSDLAAAAAMIAGAHRWVWDVRSFWIDQRIALGMTQPGSFEERVGRRIERAAARRSSAITVLSVAGAERLAERHGSGLRDKTIVVSTCVDLDAFPLTPLPPPERIVLLLSGTFNALYDRALTFRFVDAVTALRPVSLQFVRPEPSPWDADVVSRGGTCSAADFAEMPYRVSTAHAGVVLLTGRSVAATVAAMPTKVAEFLASGRPIVTTPKVGDVEALIKEYRCGVVVASATDDALTAAARELIALLADTELPARCREAATTHFDLDRGVDALLRTYRRIMGIADGPGP
ncbi:MAG: hypothetical protein H0U21_00205 [Acidimicrobiia bacterium]|nr:hypothetical protein [Acidimicrobiia bacterium]